MHFVREVFFVTLYIGSVFDRYSRSTRGIPNPKANFPSVKIEPVIFAALLIFYLKV